MSVAETVRLDGEATIYRADELKSALLAPLGKGAAQIEVDLSEVSEIDTVGVQLLLLALRDAKAQGASLRVSACSPAVAEAFALLDLNTSFGVQG